MADWEMRPCSIRRVMEEAAALGEEGVRSTKRTAEAEVVAGQLVGSVKEKKATAVEEASEDEGKAAAGAVVIAAAEVGRDAVDVTAAAVTGVDCGEDEMRWTDFVVAKKRLSQEEVDFILAWERTPFESTYVYRNMTAAEAPAEELASAAADHKAKQDSFYKFQERVREQYEQKGIFEVDDEYIARRVKMDAHIKDAWEKMISELDLHDSDFASDSDEEVQEGDFGCTMEGNVADESNRN